VAAGVGARRRQHVLRLRDNGSWHSRMKLTAIVAFERREYGFVAGQVALRTLKFHAKGAQG
jgi:hypothetical protein